VIGSPVCTIPPPAELAPSILARADEVIE